MKTTTKRTIAATLIVAFLITTFSAVYAMIPTEKEKAQERLNINRELRILIKEEQRQKTASCYAEDYLYDSRLKTLEAEADYIKASTEGLQ